MWSRSTARSGGAASFDVVRASPQPAPPFALADLDGQTVRLDDLRGRVVFVNVWATWCKPCREELPAMSALGRELGARGLTILAVNHQEAPGVVAAFARAYDLTLPVLLDPDGLVARQYRAVGLPASYFIDRSGQLVGSALGVRAWHTPPARAYLEELLAARS